MCLTDLIEAHAGFHTTPLFWDCECEQEYIHPAFVESCPACGANRAEQPDSRLEEIFRHAYDFRLPPVLVDTLIAAAESVDPSLAALAAIPF